MTVRYSKNTDYWNPKTVSAKDYTLKYGKFNSKGKFIEKTVKDVGYYYVQVNFKSSSKFKGIPAQYYQFQVRPQKAKITQKKVKGNKASVLWKKFQKVNATRYVLEYSSNARLKDDNFEYTDIEPYKYKEVKNTVNTFTFSKIGKGKKNYIRVRAYKNVTYYDSNGIKGYDRLYGDWSNPVTVTFK